MNTTPTTSSEPIHAPALVTLERKLLTEIEAALRTAADHAEERCIVLCNYNPPRPEFIETLPISCRRLARSFYKDCIYLQQLANDLKNLHS